MITKKIIRKIKFHLLLISAILLLACLAWYARFDTINQYVEITTISKGEKVYLYPSDPNHAGLPGEKYFKRKEVIEYSKKSYIPFITKDTTMVKTIYYSESI